MVALAKTAAPDTQKPRNARLWSWWAHTDLNRGPKDYELVDNAGSAAKIDKAERRYSKVNPFIFSSLA
jgi:hypothetical protein